MHDRRCEARQAEPKSSLALYLAMGGVALLAVAAIVSSVLLQRRGARRKDGGAGGGNFCAQCRHKTAASDRFCAKCGAALS